MKKLITVVCFALIGACANAGTSVDWFFSWGMYSHGAGNLQAPLPDGVASSQDVLWQLVYTGTDNAIDLVDSSNVGGAYAYDDDVVIAYRTTLAGGSGVYDAQLYTGGSQPAFESATTYTGSFYVRVFQTTSPAIGDWYYNSSMITAANIDLEDSGRTPQSLDGNTDGFNRGDALNVQIVAVPEPSSMALLALGLGVVALRRKFRK